MIFIEKQIQFYLKKKNNKIILPIKYINLNFFFFFFFIYVQ